MTITTFNEAPPNEVTRASEPKASQLQAFIAHRADPQVVPPYSFPGLVYATFTLNARRDVLQKICDATLNAGLAASSRFVVFQPKVAIDVIWYPKMIAINGPKGINHQNEIVFRFPIQDKQFTKANQEFLWFCPLIFVDNYWSAVAGREVIGMPKMLAVIKAPKDKNDVQRYAFAGFTDVFQESEQQNPNRVPSSQEFLWIEPTDKELEKHTLRLRWPWGNVDPKDISETDRNTLATNYEVDLEEEGARAWANDMASFKQFRDPSNGALASYTAILRSEYLFKIDSDAELEPAIICVTPWPDFDIIAELGLETQDKPVIGKRTTIIAGWRGRLLSGDLDLSCTAALRQP